MHFEDWIDGNLVLGFSTDGFLTKLAIFSAINFFVLGSAPTFTETLVTPLVWSVLKIGLKGTWF